MCTLVILHRPGAAWPLLVVGNRDEMRDRAWQPPARHWPEHPDIVAGRDCTAGGTWFGINDDGVVAAIMNRRGTLGPAAGARSRGELVLEALSFASAEAAARHWRGWRFDAYRSFNLVFGDAEGAWWLRHEVAETSDDIVAPLRPGLHMITAGELDDSDDPRIRYWLPQFAAAPPPDPERDDWHSWQAMLASRDGPEGCDPLGAMNVQTERGFGTVCSQLAAVPARRSAPLVFHFAPGPPDTAVFEPVAALND